MIGDYWEDIVVYVIEFTATTAGGKHMYRKTVAFDRAVNKEDINNLISVYFKNVDRILYIDELTDGLYLKGR